MILRLLFTAAVAAVACAIFCQLRRWDRDARLVRGVVRDVSEDCDSAEVMREMEWRAEADDVVNCRTTGRA